MAARQLVITQQRLMLHGLGATWEALSDDVCLAGNHLAGLLVEH